MVFSGSLQKTVYIKQDCSYQGESLNITNAFLGLLSSNNLKKLNVKNKKK